MIYIKDGNIPLNLAYDDDIVQEANSSYQLSFKFPLTDGKWNLLKREVFLLANDLHGEQEFFIFEVKKAKGHVQVYAKQVATLLNYYSINSISVDRVPGRTVMTALAGSIKRNCPFTFFSDIMDRHTFNESNVSVMDALAKDKHSIVGQWGGDLVRDKYQVKLLKNGGIENESLFMYKKNLSSYEETENINNLKTRLHLKKVIKGQAEGDEDHVIAVTVDSPLIGQYRQIYEADIEVNDQDVTDEASLLAYGQRYFGSTLCDLVENSINLDVKGKSDVSVKMFDTVSVFHERFDVDLRLKITSYHFAPMSKRLKSIGFGKVSQSFGSTVASMVAGSVDKATGRLSASFEQKLQKEIDNANRHFDAEFEKRKVDIYDGIEKAQAEAERYADNIKQQIDGQFAESVLQYQLAQQAQDRQIADVLANTNLAKQLAEQAKADLAQTRTNLTQLIDQANTKANQLEQSLGSVRTDVMSQAQSLLAQARAQADLTSRVATVELTANSTKMTVSELSKTVSKATGDIASVSSRTKTVEDNLSQTRTQYEALTQTVNAQTGQIDSINRKTADLQSGIDGVTERFKNLRIEENLLLNSSFNENLNQWQGNGVTIVDGKARITGEFNKTKIIYQSIKSQTANDDVNQVYIASISVKVTNYVAGSINPYLAFYLDGRKNDSVNTWFGGTYLTSSRLDVVNNRGVVQFATTFRINVPRNQIKSLDFYIYARDFTGEVEFEKVSLRRGNIDLGWQASPEDLRSEIATYKRTAEESSAELSRQIQTVDGKVVDAKNYAQQTAEGFKTRIESLESYKNAEGTRASQYFTASRDETARQVSALRTAVTDGYVAKAKYEEDARGVTQRFESLQVGGRNLLASKYLTNVTTSESFILKGWASTFINSANLRNIFKAGETYTLSFDAKILTKSSISKVYAQQVGFSLYSRSTNRNINFYVNNLRNANDSVRFELTFVCPEIADDHCVYFYTNRYADGTSIDYDTVEFSNVNLMTGNIVSKSWIVPQEDQQSYADTKIAEYKNTVDGRFATMQSQVSGKANQVDLQTVRETVNLYERIIGSTETGIKDKVARMVMADSLFLTEVKDKISGTATQVNQLSNSWAVKNLTSNGQILNQINLLANGTNRIDGRLTHITGQTLIDNGVINNAMIGNLDAGKISTGTLNAARIATNSIDGSKLVFDQAFVNKMTANEALFKQLFAKNAFITSVQAVTLSASQITSGVMRATNGAMEVNLNAGQILYYTDQAALKRVLSGYPTQFVKFATGTVTGKGTAGVTVIGSNRGNSESSNDGGFVGIRAWNGSNIDQIDVVGDTVRLASSTFESADGWTVNTLPGKLDIDAFNTDHRASSKIKVGDLWLWKNATTYSSMRDTINLIIDNLQLLHNNKSTERAYSYTLPAKV